MTRFALGRGALIVSVETRKPVVYLSLIQELGHGSLTADATASRLVNLSCCRHGSTPLPFFAHPIRFLPGRILVLHTTPPVYSPRSVP